MATINKKLERKAWLSRLFTTAWQFVRLDGLSLSKALRKAWVIYTALQKEYRFSPSMFESTSIDIVCKSEYIGTIKILEDGFINAKNRLHSSKIFLNRHDAISFAISNMKSKAIAQLPLL